MSHGFLRTGAALHTAGSAPLFFSSVKHFESATACSGKYRQPLRLIKHADSRRLQRSKKSGEEELKYPKKQGHMGGCNTRCEDHLPRWRPEELLVDRG